MKRTAVALALLASTGSASAAAVESSQVSHSCCAFQPFGRRVGGVILYEIDVSKVPSELYHGSSTIRGKTGAEHP